MGCDGWLEDDGEPEVTITCYRCGEAVDGENTHNSCMDENGIPVSVDIKDYYGR